MTIEPHESASLALAPDQYEFTAAQKAALVHIGVANADDGDLHVFAHVCKRTGLDPFAKQIYMIGRNTRELVDGEWRTVVKQTIQTGIDGFRLIADRADRRDGTMRAYEETLWANGEGVWSDVWPRVTAPAAAKVTVLRGGSRFPSTVMYHEYVQVNRDGNATGVWARMPANQLAKCAEAAALRKAYPQDLAGIYTDDEMGQADNHETIPASTQQTPTVTAEQITGATVEAKGSGPGSPGGVDQPVEDGPAGSEPPQPDPNAITDEQSREIGQLLQQIDVTERKAAVEYLNTCLDEGRTVRARKDLTRTEADGVLLSLRDDVAKKMTEEAGAARDATATGDTGQPELGQ